MKNILVVGLAPLGEALVRELNARKVRIFGVDLIPERVERMARLARPRVATLDATQRSSLQEFLGGKVMDVGVVAIGGNFLKAEQVAETLKNLTLPDRKGKPQVKRILVTANRPHRARILETLGHQVVRPILTAATSLATRLCQEGLLSFQQLGANAAGEPLGAGVVRVPGAGEPLAVDVIEQVPELHVLACRPSAGDPWQPPKTTLKGGWELLLAGPAQAMSRAVERLERLQGV